MRMHLGRMAAVCVVLAGLTMSAGAQFNRSDRSSAEVGINTVHAPVPDPLLKGKKAFISYELGDVTAFPSSYSGGPERAYAEFYAQMQAWDRYQLVSDPKDADVVFAVRFVDPPAIPHPQIRIGVSDPHGRVSLWGFVEEVNFAFFKKHRDAAFTETVKELINDVKVLVDPTAPPAH
ncbi:hypothetical protein [Granulicella tundricola]|uniref:Uncharacterized protein n=1 Tax=Granulicella tundricola (strain ATCC BAA-1859 / DSM 23138 / MP5ACTX9) TaxID=1198114 RepID=E8WXE5_GRATM|nr:hypothetical protein [Granulicella tundricola]ADW67478.1 hypothetical protein AciX9_0406 [Granulicella tundricola MP5ACTX9]